MNQKHKKQEVFFQMILKMQVIFFQEINKTMKKKKKLCLLYFSNLKSLIKF